MYHFISTTQCLSLAEVYTGKYWKTSVKRDDSNDYERSLNS